MNNQFPFQILDGFRRSAGEITSHKSSLSSGLASHEDPLLQQLVGDVTENNLPLVLEAFQKRLNALLEDRNQTGRDLHDCVLQPLFAIRLSLETHRRACTHVPSETTCCCDHSIEQLNELIQEIRRMIRGLEEGGIQEFDLMSEMYAMINTYEQLGRLQI